jgi:hypothetical protein
MESTYSVNNDNKDTCCICMETVNTTATGHITSKCCKHLIHINCFVSYTLTNKQRANKCPMCRYDINTGKPFEESEYPEDEMDRDGYGEDENSEDENSEDETYYYYYNDEGEYSIHIRIPDTPVVLQPVRVKSRTAAELQTYYTTPYISPITTQPVNLSNLLNYSDTGSAFYTSEKYDCLATYNPEINGITIKYQTKPPLNPVTNHRDFRCDGVPRCVSIQTHPDTDLLYVLIVYPDDGECDKMVIYFPHGNHVIMSAFYEKLNHCSYLLDNLQITGFAPQCMGHRFIYLGNDLLTPNGLQAEVIELQKLKHIYNSSCG